MANPISSFVICLDQVPRFILTDGTSEESGASKGIPVSANIRRIESDSANGYVITFDITGMTKAAAEALNVEVSSVTVDYQGGELTFISTGGGGGGGDFG